MHIHHTPSEQANCWSGFVFRDACVTSETCERRWESRKRRGIRQRRCSWIDDENKACVKFPKREESTVGFFVPKKVSPSEPTLTVIAIQPLSKTKRIYLILDSLHYPSKKLFRSPEKDISTNQEDTLFKTLFLWSWSRGAQFKFILMLTAAQTEHVFSISAFHPRASQPGRPWQTFITTPLHSCGLQISVQGKNKTRRSQKAG